MSDLPTEQLDKSLFGGVPPLSTSHQRIRNRYASYFARYRSVSDKLLFSAVPPQATSHQRIPNRYASHFARYRSVSDKLLFSDKSVGTPLPGCPVILEQNHIAARRLALNCLAAMHFRFAKVRTSSVTFGDTFPKGEGMTTPQIIICRAFYSTG